MTIQTNKDLPDKFQELHDPAVVASILVSAIITSFLAVIVYSLIRAYTGIFEVRNLRVWVASAVLILPLILMPTLAFSLSGRRRIFVLVIPLMAMLPVGGGEWLAMELSGQAIVWQKFNLIWLGLEAGFALIGCVGVFFKDELLK